MFPASFWLYLVSRFGSATAMMMLRAAVAWHVYALSRSAFLLGLIGLVQFVPALALTLVGGALADSYDRRRIMMRAQVVPLVSAAALFLATRSGAATLPPLYGVLLPFGGAGALLPIYATEILHVGPKGYGILSSSFEAGALLMSFLLTALPPITRAGRALLGTVAIYGLATIVFGLSRWFPLSVLAYAAVGMADQVSVVLRSTTIQLSTPDALRGRVSSINLLFIGASNQLGAAESGFLAALTGPTFSVVTGGAASIV